MTTDVIQSVIDPSHRMRPMRIARNRNKEPTRRVLFREYPIDHVATQKFLLEEFEKEKLQASQTWDFDFVNGVPKDTGNRYEWTQISLICAPRRPKKPEPEPDITDLYASPLPSTSRVQNETLLQNELNEEVTVKKQEQKEVEIEKSQQKQTKMTDFMVIRKRNSESISKKSTESVIPSKISKYNNDVTS